MLAGFALVVCVAFVTVLSADGAPPTNDDWANAITIDGASGSSAGTTVEATVETLEPLYLNEAGAYTDRTVWWTWQAPTSDTYWFGTAPSGPPNEFTSIAVFTGSSIDTLTEVTSDILGGVGDFIEPRVFVNADAGTTYYIQVGSPSSGDGVPGAVTLKWALNVVENDDFADATLLTDDSNAVGGWNVGATLEPPDEPDPFGGGLGNTVWYSWTPSEDGLGEFAVSALPDYPTPTLAVYTGTELASLEPAGTASSGEGLLSDEFDVVGGTTYHIQVGTDGGTPGRFTVLAYLYPRPDNDNLTDAITIDPVLGSDMERGVTYGATLENQEPTDVQFSDASPSGINSVWYRWTPAATGDVTVSVHTLGDIGVPLVQLYRGPAADPTMGDLEVVVAHGPYVQDSVDVLHAPVDAGQTYYIQVMSDFNSETDPKFVFELSAGFDNDLFANATVLEGTDGTIAGSTIGATFPEGGEPDPSGDIDNTVWYAVTAPADGPATITISADFGAAAAVYTGTAVDSLTGVKDDSDSTDLTLPFDAVAGTTYYIQVGTYSGDAPGLFELAWHLPALTPENDDLADAIDVSGPNGAVDGTTNAATTEAGEVTQVDVGGTPRNGSHSVWYRWMPGASGEVVLAVTAHPEVGIDHEPLVQLYEGPAVAPTYGALRATGTHDSLGTVRDTVDGVNTYYVQVMSDIISEGNPDFDFTLTWASTRELSGFVRTADGSTVPGVLVRVCRGAVCEDTTSNSDGFYDFTDLAPGAYVVRALPADPAMLAVQLDADLTLASVQGLDLRLVASGASSTENGPSTFLVSGCAGGSLHYVATGDGTPLGSGDVADGAGGTPIDGVFTIDVSSLAPGHFAMLRLDITITCALGPSETQTALLFTDPSGTVVDDAAGGAGLAGATVTLLDASGTPIPAGDRRLSPATAANPETSDARGAWAWDVTSGTYYVRAQKTGCGTTTSGALVVTPANPVSGVVLHLSCGTPPEEPTPTPTPPGFPPSQPPPSTLPDPVQGVNFNVVPISGTVLVNGAVLPAGQQIPFGATIDATNGVVSITTIGPNGQVQTAYFFGGEFQLLLDPDGVTNLALRGGDFTACPAGTVNSAKVKGRIDRRAQGVRATAASARTKATKIVRSLWGTGKGSFRTSGRFSSATVRGTLWFTADRCDGTYTRVTQGSVTVLDFSRNTQVVVRAWHPVLVQPG